MKKALYPCLAIFWGLFYPAGSSYAIGPLRSGANPPFEKQAAACKKKIDAAQRRGVLKEFEWKLPKEPHVVVGAKFLEAPLRTQESLLATVNCYLNAGEISQCLNFDVISFQTSTRVGRFESCKFIRKG